MTYENRPGFGALFRNKHREKDNHPNAKGDICCPGCGKHFELAAWTKDTKAGEKFQSLKMSEPRGPQGRDPGPSDEQLQGADYDPDQPF